MTGPAGQRPDANAGCSGETRPRRSAAAATGTGRPGPGTATPEATAPEGRATGTLYVCATPIGNLEDITMRALRILRAVDLIAAEDTRQTRKLLAHYDIAARMVSCHEHNERAQAARIIEVLLGGGDVALVSDAGTPVVSEIGRAHV